MFIIRQAQMKAFEEYMVKDFVARTSTYLSETYPQEISAMNFGDLEAFVRLGISRAFAYEIDDEEDVRQYLDLMTRFGKDFEGRKEFSWATGIFKDNGLDGKAKIEKVIARVDEEMKG